MTETTTINPRYSRTPTSYRTYAVVLAATRRLQQIDRHLFILNLAQQNHLAEAEEHAEAGGSVYTPAEAQGHSGGGYNVQKKPPIDPERIAQAAADLERFTAELAAATEAHDGEKAETYDVELACRIAKTPFVASKTVLLLDGTTYHRGDPVPTAVLKAMPPRRFDGLLKARAIEKLIDPFAEVVA